MDKKNLTPEEETKEEIRKLRTTFININAKISRLISPKIFKLRLESIQNLRNLAIISGAIASFGLAIINNVLNNAHLIFIGIAGLLTNTVLIFSYLNETVNRGINAYSTKLAEELELSIDAQEIINDRLDEKINQKEFSEKIKKIFGEIELKKIRPPNEKTESEIEYATDLFVVLFAFSVLLLIISLLFKDTEILETFAAFIYRNLILYDI